MKAFLILLAVIVAACRAGGMDQRPIRHALGVAALGAYDVLERDYRRDALQIVEAAGSSTEAIAGLAALRERWAPRWAAWDAFVVAFEAWSGEEGDIAPVRTAYCRLRGWATMPAFPGGCAP